MADLMACPSCSAMLRVPAGAGRIRCPKCRTEVAVAVPPGPAAAKPGPLPFDRPEKPRSQPVPMAIAMPPDKPVVKGRLIREEEERPEREDRGQAKSRRQRREETLKDDPRYETVAEECRAARTGLGILAAGAIAAAIAAVSLAAFLGTIAVSSSVISELFWLTVGMLGLHGLCILIGYGFCIAGPRGMRSSAIIGIIVTLMHLGVLVPLVAYAAGPVRTLDSDAGVMADSAVPKLVFRISSSLNNLNSLTDLPWLAIRSELEKPDALFVVLMLFGALLEFAKMSALGTIVQYYASESKSHELGFRSLRFVYRIIWVVIVAMVAKLGIYVLFGAFAGEAAANQFFRIPVTLLTVAYFLWWTFAWFAQYSSMVETIGMLTPGRILDRRLSLDEV